MNRTFACSDLHGRYDLWTEIKGFLDPTDTLYMLGDATDRGPNGWKLLKEVLIDQRVKYIRGNHDNMILECWREDWVDTYLWFRNGGYTTYSQMMLDEEKIINLYLTELAKTPYRMTYINKDNTTVYLSHAGFTPKLRETEDIHQYLWDRDHIYDEKSDWQNEIVVFGHTPIKYLNCGDIEFNENHTIAKIANGHKIDIDNGCVFSNKISILDLNTWETFTFEAK